MDDSRNGTARVHRVSALSDNYIWLYEYAPGRAAAIDPAEAGPVRAALAEHRLTLTHILNTHWHPDHVGGNLELKQATGCAIIGPKREQAKIPGIDRAVDEGDTVTLGSHAGEVLFVGAHTAGHIAYWFADAAILFPGDTLFAMGCGRLFEGSAADMHAALGRIAALPADTMVYCAHEYTLSNARFALTVEPDNQALVRRAAQVEAMRSRDEPTVPFLLADERATNPFMRAGSVDELAARRQAKDRF